MVIGIVTTDVTAAGANGAAGPQIIVPVIDRVAGDREDVDGRHDPPISSADLQAIAHDVATAEPAVLRRPSRLMALMADPVSREALRFRVEETLESFGVIADRFGVNRRSLSRESGRAGWIRLPDAPKAPPIGTGRRFASSLADAGLVTGRLLRLVDQQVAKMDARLKKRNSEIEEKDSRILGHLARTLATLMALDRDDGATAKEPERVDRDELNADLARRIRRWAEGREEPA